MFYYTVIRRLCFSGIGVSVCKQVYVYLKSYERILMKFSGAVASGRSDQVFGPVASIIPRRVNNVKSGGLEEVCTL